MPVIPHLVVESSIAWRMYDAAQEKKHLGSRPQLHFTPLRTSDAGIYTCTASVNVVPTITEDESRNLFVASKCKKCKVNLYF